MLKIFIIDHHALFREGLSNLLQHEQGFQVIGEADSIFQAMEKLKNQAPDLVLVDAELPDLDDFYGVRLLCARHRDMQVVLLSKDDSQHKFLDAIRNGARGYLTKNNSLNSLVASIHALERGEAVIPRAMVGSLLEELARLTPVADREEVSLLTPREIEVLRELGRGGSNRQIATSLDIAENTVKVHVHNILDKLNLPNRRQAARFARTKGISNQDSQYRAAFLG